MYSQIHVICALELHVQRQRLALSANEAMQHVIAVFLF